MTACSSSAPAVSQKFRVLICDPIDPKGVDLLCDVATLDVRVKLSEDEICQIIHDYDALMVRSGTTVTKKIIDRATNLSIIGRAGVGVDNVDVKAATERGIYVVNSPFGNVVAAAEHTLGLIISMARNIAAGDASIRSGKWDRSKFVGTQLQGKTLGIVGLGQVGGALSNIAHHMGMKILGYDPFVNEMRAATFNCTMVDSLDTLFMTSDFISLHVPKLEETYHMVNSRRLGLMKNTARIVNCSRGGVVDEVALAEALNEGIIAGAALDVFEVEKPFAADHPLLKAKNLVVTPHLGASTEEAQLNVAVDVAEQIRDTLTGGLPRFAVNAPVRGAVGPLMQCSETVGKVAAQLLGEPIERVEVFIEGEYAKEAHQTEVLLLAAANGVLGAHLDIRVNYVNVRRLAESNKVTLIVATELQARKSAIRVVLTGHTRSSSAVGSLSAEGDPLLKAVEGIPVFMPIPPSECAMLLTEHVDRPNALGQLTSILGQADINIANCHLGRRRRCSSEVMERENSEGQSTRGPVNEVRAIALFHVDDKIEPEVLDKLRKLPMVQKCVVLRV